MSRYGAVACTALALAGVGLLTVSPVADLDVWWLLQGGRYMVDTRSFPVTDPFSATAAGSAWVNHAWGFELLLYGAYRLAGFAGLILLQVGFAVLTFGLCYRLLRAEGSGQGAALVLVALGAVATWGFWAPRPQLVTYLGLALYWAAFRDYRDGRADRLGWLVPLTVVWANLHGGFIVGPALLALGSASEWAGRLFRGGAPGVPEPPLARVAWITAASTLASLVNPFHYHALLFPFQVMGDSLAKGMIVEWASPPFQHPQAMLLEGMVLATLLLLLAARRPVAFSDLGVVAAFVHLALQSRRNVPLLVILLLPVMGRLWADFAPRAAPALAVSGLAARWRVPAVVAGALLPVAAWAAIPPRPVRELVPRLGVARSFPAGAVEFLRREPRSGALFNDYDWGGYLIWHLYPQYRVWVDGRAAVYGPRRLAEHAEVDEVRPRWREVLDRSGVRLMLIRSRSPLATALRERLEWQVLYEDEVAVVFDKRGSGT